VSDEVRQYDRERDYNHLAGHTYAHLRNKPGFHLLDRLVPLQESYIHWQVCRDLVVLLALEERGMAAKKATTKKAAKKETAMTVEKNLPDPTKGQAAWVSAMVDSGVINMRDYRDYSGKDKRLWMVEGARRVSAGLHSKLLEVELTAIGDERVNCFKASDDCKAFWKNGREQNMTEEQILEGWLAMMSMQEDVGPKA
jgi:hypothetical protein